MKDSQTSPIFSFGSTPLYSMIYDYLSRIISEMEPGEKLPSERELEDKFNVSKVTVRRAYQELVFENKISRIAGKGSYVAEHRIEPLTALTGFSENMRSLGFEPSYRQSVVSLSAPRKQVADFFRIDKNEIVLNVFRVMCANKLPLAIQDAYFPIEIYKKNPSTFTPEVLNQISIYRILELDMEIKLFRADESVEASFANKQEADILNIKEGDPILIIERRTYSASEQPIEFVKLIYPSKKYRYKVELFRP